MSDLRERVARAMSADDNDGDDAVFDLMNNGYRDEYRMRARTAIAIVLEEAARCANGYVGCDNIAAAIRALATK